MNKKLALLQSKVEVERLHLISEQKKNSGFIEQIKLLTNRIEKIDSEKHMHEKMLNDFKSLN